MIAADSRTVCPKCSGRLRFVVTAALEYSVNPYTGKVGKRILATYEGAFGRPSAKCIACGSKFEVETDDDGRITDMWE